MLHNDTPCAFVVQILEESSRIPADRATAIMMAVHNSDRGIIEAWTREVAESGSNTANKLAREYGSPMMTTIEPG